MIPTKKIHLTKFCRISDECLVFGCSNKDVEGGRHVAYIGENTEWGNLKERDCF
jgi:hypothetical protein